MKNLRLTKEELLEIKLKLSNEYDEKIDNAIDNYGCETTEKAKYQMLGGLSKEEYIEQELKDWALGYRSHI